MRTTPLIDAKILCYTPHQVGMEGYYVNRDEFGGETTYGMVFLSEGRMYLTSCMEALIPTGDFAGPVILRK